MARERYLVNAGEDTIHRNEIKPVTPKQKRQNWWFYHKTHLIVSIIALVIVGSIVYSVVTRVDPDYTVALMTSYTMPDSGRTELERCLTQYADDRNGDGKIKVTVVNYVFSDSSSTSTDAQQQQAAWVKFTADCTTNESMIFLHDEAAFESMKSNFTGFFRYNDGTPMPESAVDYENAMRPWSDFKAFTEFVPVTEENDPYDSDILQQLFSKLRVSVRTAEGSSIEKKEKDMLYYEDSLKLYERVESGEKLTEAE